MSRLLGIVFCASVFLAGGYAFSPRSIPQFPATGLRVDTVLLLDAARAGARLVAAGERGRIFLSDDEGAGWRPAKSPTEATLTALYFVDARRGWAVGHDAVILRSTDGGESWQQVHSAPEEQRPLLDIRFLGAEHGIAIGAYGAYLESRDGGRTWAARRIAEGDRHFNALAAAGDRQYIAGESGTLLSSEDRGAQWVALASPYKGSLFGILGAGGSDLVAFGLRGNVFHSANQGRDWRAAESTTQASLMGGRALAPGTAVLAGQDGTLLVTRDGGRSFTLHRHAGGSAFATVAPAANGDLLAFGERGVTRIPGMARP
ncbi:MAG: sialidase [Betaproteobacteria bacterium]|nr:sialidase [Betaproteobacteria bacterium]